MLGSGLFFGCVCGALLATAASVHGASEESPDVPLYKKPLWSRPKSGETINLLVFSPDGRTLVSAKHDGTIELWNAATGKKLQTISFGRVTFFKEMAFSKDGKLLGIVSYDGTLLLWSVAAKKKLRADFGKREINAIAFAPDGKTLALGTESGEILLWDLARKRVQRILQKKGWAVNNLAFSADGKRLASAERIGNCVVWDLEKKTSRSYDNLGGRSKALRFTGKGVLLAERRESLIRLFPGKRKREEVPVFNWGRVSGRESRDYHTGMIKGLAPGGAFAALYETPSYSLDAPHKELLLWNVADQRLFARLAIGGSEVKTVVFAPNGKLAVGTEEGGIQMWELPPDLPRKLVPSEADVRALGPLIESVRAVAFSPDGRILASAARSAVWLWDPAAGKETHCLKQPAGEVCTLAFSADGKLLASGGTDRIVRLRDPASGKARGTLDKQKGVVLSLAFTPDGKLLASGDSSGAVLVWDLNARKERWLLKGHRGAVYAVFVAADGRTLISGGADGFVRFWDLTTGKETRKLSLKGPIESYALTPDRKTLVAATQEGALSFWDVASGRSLALSVQVGTYPRCLAFAPGGRMLASASIASGMKLWRLDAKTIVPDTVVLGSISRSVRCLAFAPDGRTLATGSNLEGVRVWSLRRAR